MSDTTKERRTDEVAKPQDLTRRSFVKSATAAAGLAALGLNAEPTLRSLQLAHADEQTPSAEVQVYTCTCRNNCSGNGCAMNVSVKDGKAFNIDMFTYDKPEFNSICQRGFTNLERLYATTRIKYPMRRIGERGADEWERIGWDDAINEICTKWKSYQKDFGKSSILFTQGGGNNSIDVDYVQRLSAFMGASTSPNNFDNNGMLGMMKFVGVGASFCGNDWRDLENAKTILMWGCNITDSYHTKINFLWKALESGSEMIVIDPNFVPIAGRANQFIPIRPGSDGLLAIGMTLIILRDGLQDEEFLKQQTVAPYLVKDSDGLYLRLSDIGKAKAGSLDDAIVVRGADGSVDVAEKIKKPVIHGSFTINGTKVTTAYDLLLKRLEQYNLEQVVELTDIPLNTIEELTAAYMSGPSTIVTGYGIDHYANGLTGYACMLMLCMVSGQLARKGSGMAGGIAFPIAFGNDNTAMLKPPTANQGSGSTFTFLNNDTSGDTSSEVYVPGPSIYGNQIPDVVKTGKWGEVPVTLKSLYIYGENLLGNFPDRLAWLEVFNQLELVVVADLNMSDTARYADIVLPASFYFETESFSLYQNPYVRISEQAVEPQFESKSDFEIANLLAAGMELGDEFALDKEDYFTKALDNDLAKQFGLSWENLKRDKAIYAYPEEPFILGQGGFPTPTGRAQFYLEGNVPISDYGQEWDAKWESLPYWEPPHEAWFENEKFAQYPLVFTSERSKFKVHTMHTYVPTLLELEPEPFVKISRLDADERKISDGDIVKVHNERGYVVVKAYINDGVRKGMVVIDHGWQGDQFIEGHYSDLSSRWNTSAIPNMNYFDCLCQIEKIG